MTFFFLILYSKPLKSSKAEAKSTLQYETSCKYVSPQCFSPLCSYKSFKSKLHNVQTILHHSLIVPRDHFLFTHLDVGQII